MLQSSVTNGSVDSYATNTARQLERLTWQGRAGAVDSVSAVLARGVCAVIPLFFTQSRSREAVKLRRSEAIRAREGLT